jgi:hypothetical protein
VRRLFERGRPGFLYAYVHVARQVDDAKAIVPTALREAGSRPPRKRSTQRGDERAVNWAELQSTRLPTQDRQLVSQHQDLQLLGTTRPGQQRTIACGGTTSIQRSGPQSRAWTTLTTTVRLTSRILPATSQHPSLVNQTRLAQEPLPRNPGGEPGTDCVRGAEAGVSSL